MPTATQTSAVVKMRSVTGLFLGDRITVRVFSNPSRSAAEGEAKLTLAHTVCGDLGIDLIGVIAALGERLRPALESRLDLFDLGAGVLQRIDPVPFGRQPGTAEMNAPLLFVIGQGERARNDRRIEPARPDPSTDLPDHDRVLVGLDAAAKFEERQPRVRVIRLQHVVRQIGVRNAERRRDLKQGAVLERLVGLADIGRRRGLHVLARLQHHDLAGLQVHRSFAAFVTLGDIEGLGRRRRGDEQRMHRRDLLPVELGVIVLVEQEQLHDARREAEIPAAVRHRPGR